MRFKHIDILRGIAAMLVTVFHLTRSSDVQYSFDYAKYGWVGVQIFFVISGFILPFSLLKANYDKDDFLIFIAKRVVRIYPAYLSAMIIGIILTVITGRDLISVSAFFSQLIFLNDIFGLPSSSPVFWTLAIEFQFYLLLAVLYSYFFKSNSRSIICVLLLAFATFIFNTKSLIFFWFPFFGVGILTFNKVFTKLSNRAYLFLLFILLGIIVLQHGVPHATAALFAALFIMYGNYKKENIIVKVLLFMGTISYSLYLIHWDLGRATVRFSRHVSFLKEFGELRVILGFTVSIICAYLLYLLIERNSAKSSANINYKRKQKL